MYHCPNLWLDGSYSCIAALMFGWMADSHISLPQCLVESLLLMYHRPNVWLDGCYSYITALMFGWMADIHISLP